MGATLLKTGRFEAQIRASQAVNLVVWEVNRQNAIAGLALPKAAGTPTEERTMSGQFDSP